MKRNTAIKLMMVMCLCVVLAANVMAYRRQVMYSSFEYAPQTYGTLRFPIFTGTSQTFSNPLVVNATTANQVDAITGEGFYATGSQYVQVPDNSAYDLDSGDFAISFWVKTTSTKTFNTILDKRNSSGCGWHVVLYRGWPLMRIDDTSAGGYNYYSSSSSASVNDGQWHFVYIYVDTGGYYDSKIYVDGNPVLTFDPTRHTGSIANSDDLYIGKHRFSSSYGFVGTMDEIKIFN